MKKAVRLTEQDLVRLIKKTINEDMGSPGTTSNSKCPDLGPEYTKACSRKCKKGWQQELSEMIKNGGIKSITFSNEASKKMGGLSFVILAKNGNGCVTLTTNISLTLS